MMNGSVDNVDDLVYSFENVELISFHKTTRIESFQTIIDENRYIFRNLGHEDVEYIILPPRPTGEQRDLEICDRNHTSIPLIPIEKASSLYIKMSKGVLMLSMEQMIGSDLEGEFRGIKDRIEKNLEKIFTYPQQVCIIDIRKIFEDLDEFSGNLESNDERENVPRRMLRLSRFLEDYIGEKYSPLLILPLESSVDNVILIDESVKSVGEFFPDGVPRKFRFRGLFDFPYEIEPKRSVSCDYNILTPSGLVMKDITFDFDGKLKEYYNKKKNKYFDSDYFHFLLNEKESEEISESENKIINVSFGLGYNRFNFSIFTILIAVLWLCILFPTWSTLLSFLFPNLIPGVELSGDDFLSILAISTPIVVAVAVYTIDKRILRYFIETQMFLLILAFLLELIYFKTKIFSFLIELFF